MMKGSFPTLIGVMVSDLIIDNNFILICVFFKGDTDIPKEEIKDIKILKPTHQN